MTTANLLATGRDADVFAHGDGQVLRRYRDGRPAAPEAEIIRAVGDLGYPVPRIASCTGPDIVMERVDRPTLAEVLMSGETTSEAGAKLLAGLHDRLHALPWPGSAPLLHLDLHPENVIVGGNGPVVVDWSHARPGPRGLDVAMTALILAQVAVSTSDGALRSLVREFLPQFVAATTAPYADHLAEAAQLRRATPFQSDDELRELSAAVACARAAGTLTSNHSQGDLP